VQCNQRLTFDSDLECYGSLFALEIELLPARNCSIPEIFGNLHDLRTIGVNETHLILVRIPL